MSPKMAPEITAAAMMALLAPSIWQMVMQAIPPVETEVQEEPVMMDSTEHTSRALTYKNFGLIILKP